MHRSLLLGFFVLSGCATARHEVVLVEMRNERVENLPIGLRAIESRTMWRDGKHVKVELATLCRIDPDSNALRSDTFFVDDELVVAGRHWAVARVVPGAGETPGRVVLRELDR